MIFTTEFVAIDQTSGEVSRWEGPRIESITWGMAEKWCAEHRPYLKVTGQLVSEIPLKNNKPDWRRKVDYGRFYDN